MMLSKRSILLYAYYLVVVCGGGGSVVGQTHYSVTQFNLNHFYPTNTNHITSAPDNLS